MKKSIKTLEEALTFDLQQLYNSEAHLKANIPAILERIKSEPLRSILVQYSESSDLKRLKIDRMLSYLSAEPDDKPNEVISILISELRGKVSRCSGDILDLLVIPALQQICYYKIAAYRAALTFAMELELDVVADLVHDIIDWERETDRLLMELAFREFSKSVEASRS